MSTFKKAYLVSFTSLTLIATTSYAGTLPGPIVDTEWLSSNKDKVLILDVRTNPKTFKKKAKKPAVNPCGVGGAATKTPVGGHIEAGKNISLIKWNKVHTAGDSNGIKLKIMNLDQEKFVKLMEKSGVSNTTAVVITNNAESSDDIMLATRLYWTMKYYGHPEVAILDGGTYKWISEKRKISTKHSKPSKGKYEVTQANPAILASMQDVTAATSGAAQLIDSRPLGEYLGLSVTGKLVTRTGHIPTAKTWPVSTNLIMGDTITFQSAEMGKSTATALHIDPAKATITYSDTGALASLSWFVLSEILGNKNTKVYDASLNEWTQTKDSSLVAMKIE